MGRVLGITARQVRNLADRGVLPREGDDRYPVETVVQKYCSYLRAAAQARGGDSAAAAADERARLSRARAQLAEAKNGVILGELVKADEVQSTWSGIVRTVRAAMLAVPSRVASRVPDLTPHHVREIDAEIRAALTELADDNDRPG